MGFNSGFKGLILLLLFHFKRTLGLVHLFFIRDVTFSGYGVRDSISRQSCDY